MTNAQGKIQSFGGDWTETKLKVVGEYLRVYLTALKHQRFKKIYIDAFAGEGSRREERAAFSPELFADELAEPAGEFFFDGSARIALSLDPGFDRYVLIEKDAQRVDKLKDLAASYPGRLVQVVPGDANGALKQLCASTDWRRHRGVFFLDPFGLSVEWQSLEAIAGTKGLDMWFLVPIGGFLRVMKKDGEIPEAWRKKLDLCLGAGWFEALYKKERVQTLFGEEELSERHADVEALGRFVIDRLRSLFPAVAPNPLLLRNRKEVPLFLLCFAASHPKGAEIAERIATHLLSN